MATERLRERESVPAVFMREALVLVGLDCLAVREQWAVRNADKTWDEMTARWPRRYMNYLRHYLRRDYPRIRESR